MAILAANAGTGKAQQTAETTANEDRALELSDGVDSLLTLSKPDATQIALYRESMLQYLKADNCSSP
jgi:hypothetical protein